MKPDWGVMAQWFGPILWNIGHPNMRRSKELRRWFSSCGSTGGKRAARHKIKPKIFLRPFYDLSGTTIKKAIWKIPPSHLHSRKTFWKLNWVIGILKYFFVLLSSSIQTSLIYAEDEGFLFRTPLWGFHPGNPLTNGPCFIGALSSSRKLKRKEVTPVTQENCN